MKNVMKEAHEMTRRIIKKGDSYRATFRLCLIFVHSQKGENKMIAYTTKNGASVKVELEGTEISYLSVNGIEITAKATKEIFVSAFNNTIVLNSGLYFKKLGAKAVVKIEASNELMNMYKEAKKEVIRKENEKREEILKDSKSKEYTTFENHMKNVNA